MQGVGPDWQGFRKTVPLKQYFRPIGRSEELKYFTNCSREMVELENAGGTNFSLSVPGAGGVASPF